MGRPAKCYSSAGGAAFRFIQAHDIIRRTGGYRRFDRFDYDVGNVCRKQGGDCLLARASGEDRYIEFVGGLDNVLRRKASVRQEGVGEAVDAGVAPGVGMTAAFQQGEARFRSAHTDPVFAVVEKRYSIAGFGEVGPFVLADLEHGFLDRRVPRCRSHDVAELDFVPGRGNQEVEVKGRFQQTVRFPPIDFGVEIDPLASRMKNHVLPERRASPDPVFAAKAKLQGAVLRYVSPEQGVLHTEFQVLVYINVPVVPRCGDVFSRQEGVEWRAVSSQFALRLPVE
jgi:hypothetical protein